LVLYPGRDSSLKVASHCALRIRVVFLNFAGPRPAGPAGSIQPLTSETPPWQKRPPRPGQGGRSAPRWHRRVARGPPPTTPLGGWSPQVTTTAREAKKRPSQGGPGCACQNQNPNQKPTGGGVSIAVYRLPFPGVVAHHLSDFRG
jgi:hypothetical protein